MRRNPSQPVTRRAFTCQCGRPIFFPNSVCLACSTPLGYDPERRALLPLQPVNGADWWRAFGQAGEPASGRHYRRCANLTTASACNWLIAEADTLGLDKGQCRCCRLDRTLPDLSIDENVRWWGRIEVAKRRLVSSLIAMKLPVHSKVDEDPQRGLAFDLLRGTVDQKVVTGHADGIITLDVEEADDATRELRRGALLEPYRTLLGHLRHECGHYFWQRLVEGSPSMEAFRALFGDERQDYPASLKRHYENGPPADWGERHVSAYASSHPWEDWAETWAHHLHMVDTLDTARSFGLDSETVELSFEHYGPDVLEGSGDTNPQPFLDLLNAWMELTAVFNELSRSMGVPDFYPFVLSAPAVRKLHFVHRTVRAAAETAPVERSPQGSKGTSDVSVRSEPG